MIRNNIPCKVSGMVMQCIHDLQPELPVVCEIGCAEGDGVARYGGFCEYVIAIDPMIDGRPDIAWSDDPKSTSKDRETFNKTHEIDQGKIDLFYRNVSHLSNDNYILVQGCSYWDDVVQHVRTLAEKRGGIDILVIDGCHHPYESVMKDFDLYYPMVVRDGLIVLDDIYEPCIKEVFDRVVTTYDVTVHEHWKCQPRDGLQEIGVFRKL